MDIRKQILERIESYCLEHNVSEHHFGLQVTNNHKLVSAIRRGQNITIKTADKIISYIEDASSLKR